MLLHENIPALRVVIILLVIPQAETRQGRRCLVPEKYGHEGRKGVPRGEFAQPAYTDVDQDPGQVRERARGRVHRRVLRRILAAGVQQVGAMEKSTWHGGTYIYIYRHIHTHIHTHTFCSMPIDSKPITYSTFSFFSFDLDLLTFRISFFFFKNTVVFGNTNGIFSSRIWNRTFSFDLDLAQFLKIEFFFISISTLCFHSRLEARSILNYENYY